MRTVKKIPRAKQMPRALMVAAYARVSSGKDAMLHSLAAQVEHYSSLIRSTPGWEYAGVYADEAKTGTKDNRERFQQMLHDCRAGKIDRIITKSISRFARNTITLLETVRELKALGVSVYFEEQNIDTATADGELMLTILASYAQEESLSASENQKWRVKQKFEEGIPWNGTIFGYRIVDGKYTVVPDEAEIVRGIFSDYLSGKGTLTIAKELNVLNVPTRFNRKWRAGTVNLVLRNYSYTGNLILQSTFRTDHLTKHRVCNNGEMPMYHAAESHQAIIPEETFKAVQDLMEQRKAKHTTSKPKQTYPFTGKITCSICGAHFRRKIKETGPVWICSTYDTYGKHECPSKAIPEPTLTQLAESIADINKITAVKARPDNIVEFTLTNGETAVKRWTDRSRRESWTKEKRQAASAKKKGVQ